MCIRDSNNTALLNVDVDVDITQDLNVLNLDKNIQNDNLLL